MFQFLRSVDFDTGYAGSGGVGPQSWVNGNGNSYIYFGSGQFDGQGSGHDFYGVRLPPPSPSTYRAHPALVVPLVAPFVSGPELLPWASTLR